MRQVLSHSHKDGHEFMFQFTDSAWSKVCASLVKILRRSRTFMTDGVPGSSIRRDGVGCADAETRAGQILRWCFVDRGFGEIQALEGYHTRSSIPHQELSSRLDRFQRTRSRATRSLRDISRRQGFFAGTSVYRGETSDHRLSWVECPMVCHTPLIGSILADLASFSGLRPSASRTLA